MCFTQEYKKHSVSSSGHAKKHRSLFRIVEIFNISSLSFSPLLQLSSLITRLSDQLVAKGKELNAFREKHNIQLDDEGSKDKSSSDSGSKAGAGGGVLVT